jgi:hypothetical protein
MAVHYWDRVSNYECDWVQVIILASDLNKIMFPVLSLIPKEVSLPHSLSLISLSHTYTLSKDFITNSRTLIGNTSSLLHPREPNL